MDPSRAPDPRSGDARAGSRAEIEDAIARVEGELGRDHAAVVDGERIPLAATVESRDPKDPETLLGRFPACDAERQRDALAAAADAQGPWAATPWPDRAHLLFEAAERLRRERHYHAAWLLLETGLSWEDAESEVAAAVDALEGNAREAVRRGREGEAAGAAARPFGPGVLVAPAVRPLALTVALASAALAAGNTLVLVPAASAPCVGRLVFLLLERAHAPRGTVHFVPGPVEVLARAAAVEEAARFVVLASTVDAGLPPVVGPAPTLDRCDLDEGGRRALRIGPSAAHALPRPRALFDAFLRA